MPAKADLAELWLQAPPGRLAPKEQLRAVALHDAMQEFGDGSVNYQWIANKLTVGGGGSPSREAVRVLLLRVDGDSDWYPGKSHQEKHGPAPLLSPAERRVVKEANKKCDFRLLCCEYLTRLEELVAKKGDRLKK